MARPVLGLAVGFLFVVAGRAANDWSTPCFNGECSYDLPQSSSVSGTLQISGSVDAISDITPAAGWTILDCDSTAMAQDIRLVCTASGGCPHLTQNTGSVGKLVRLPENCGQSAFARVTADWVHEDQTLPDSLARVLRRRDGTTPTVNGLSIDADFSSDDYSQAGPVNFAIHALTQTVPPTTAPQRRSRFAPAPRRGELKDRSVISVLQQAFEQFNSFNQSTMQKLQEVNFKKTFPLFSVTKDCPAAGKTPAFQASVSGEVDACMEANVTLAVTAIGTLVPANITKFGMVVGMNANLEGTLKLSGSASATVDSGMVELTNIGLPGLDFPGILTVGPSFKVQGQVTATLDLEVDLSVDLSYCVDNAKIFFPPSAFNNNSGTFTPNNSPLNFSVSPDVSSSAKLEAHIIPGLDFGISAINGLATADVFIDVDTSSSMTLSLDGSAGASGGVNSSGVAVTGTTAPSVDGCVDIGAGLAVNAGAQGKLFNAFDFAPQVNLFTKNFDFFKKCFGAAANSSSNSTSSRRDLQPMSLSEFEYEILEFARPRRRHLAARASTISCNTTTETALSKLTSLVDQTISSAKIILAA